MQAGAKHDRAGLILKSAASLGGRVSIQVLGEVFAVLTRRKGWVAKDARDVVTTIMSVVRVMPPSAASLEKAMLLTEAHGVPFWDAQIVTVAAEHGCDVVLTEDFQDGRVFSIGDLGRALTIVNPFVEANLPRLKAMGF